MQKSIGQNLISIHDENPSKVGIEGNFPNLVKTSNIIFIAGRLGAVLVRPGQKQGVSSHCSFQNHSKSLLMQVNKKRL